MNDVRWEQRDSPDMDKSLDAKRILGTHLQIVELEATPDWCSTVEPTLAVNKLKSMSRRRMNIRTSPLQVR